MSAPLCRLGHPKVANEYGWYCPRCVVDAIRRLPPVERRAVIEVVAAIGAADEQERAR